MADTGTTRTNIKDPNVSMISERNNTKCAKCIKYGVLSSVNLKV
jgi:hypothetical protein